MSVSTPSPSRTTIRWSASTSANKLPKSWSSICRQIRWATPVRCGIHRYLNGCLSRAKMRSAAHTTPQSANETLLLGCRVIGRTVETAFFAHLACEAKERGAQKIEGWFLPTRNNAPAKDFYPKHGFQQVAESEQGSRWSYDLSKPMPFPDW